MALTATGGKGRLQHDYAVRGFRLKMVDCTHYPNPRKIMEILLGFYNYSC